MGHDMGYGPERYSSVMGISPAEYARRNATRGRPLYIVIRRGEFKCNLRTHNQCGPRGTSKFEYIVTVEGHELEGNEGTGGEKNFLIEHYAMADHIANTFKQGKWAASCEAFAGSIITMVDDLMVGKATRIHVAIKPGNIAEIQLEWKLGQSLPSLLAVKL